MLLLLLLLCADDDDFFKEFVMSLLMMRSHHVAEVAVVVYVGVGRFTISFRKEVRTQEAGTHVKVGAAVGLGGRYFGS